MMEHGSSPTLYNITKPSFPCSIYAQFVHDIIYTQKRYICCA